MLHLDIFQNSIIHPFFLVVSLFLHYLPHHIWPDLLLRLPTKNFWHDNIQIWMWCIPHLHQHTWEKASSFIFSFIERQCLSSVHSVTNAWLIFYALPIIKLRSQKIIVGNQLPLRTIPFVNEVECFTIIFHLRRTQHIHQQSLPLATSPQQLAVFWLCCCPPTWTKKRFFVVLPHHQIVHPKLNPLSHLSHVHSQSIALHCSDNVYDVLNFSANLGHDIAYSGQVHCNVPPLIFILYSPSISDIRLIHFWIDAQLS